MHRSEQQSWSREALPDGLYYCRFCGEVAGQLQGHKSTCLCEGIPCGYCGIGRVRRPISDSYNPATGTFWHSPYFMGMGGCRDCVATVYGGFPREWRSWPGPLADDPALRDLLDTIKQAGLALSSDRAQPMREVLERVPYESGLYAVHGDARASGRAWPREAAG